MESSGNAEGGGQKEAAKEEIKSRAKLEQKGNEKLERKGHGITHLKGGRPAMTRGGMIEGLKEQTRRGKGKVYYKRRGHRRSPLKRP